MLTAATALFGGMSAMSKSAPKPPPVANPATPAPTARAAGATVRVGTNEKKVEEGPDADYTGFVEKRASGRALGGLGRSGLGL